MRFHIPFFAILGVATTALTQGLNTSAQYYLHTQLKAHQPGKERFDNLWLSSSHTGAALSDLVLDSSKTWAIKGFTNATKVINPAGGFYQEQKFDLGTSTSWTTLIANVVNYAAWLPVEISAVERSAEDTFFFNSTGLHYAPRVHTSELGGWLVCDWWHGVPQLFVKFARYNYTNPASCADVYLMPEYI